jgi:hypothetical protein
VTTWNNCLKSTTDVKELIPEFFYFPEFLVNKNNLDLGIKQNKEKIGNNIIHPPKVFKLNMIFREKENGVTIRWIKMRTTH